MTDAALDLLPTDVKSQIETESDQFVDRLIAALENGDHDTDPGTHEHPTTADESTWVPEEGANAIAGTIHREALEGASDAAVAVFPTRDSGILFLKENNAWGFVRIDREPGYVAMYHAGEPRTVRFVARVKSVLRPEDAPLARPLESYTDDQAEFDPDKRVVVFEPGSLYELEDPIPMETKYPQSLRYTTLERLRTGETTDDLL